MSKAPHPKSPLGTIEQAMQDHLVKVRRSQFRVAGSEQPPGPLGQAILRMAGEMEAEARDETERGTRIVGALARYAAERREDAQARRLYLRGWASAAWAWMWGGA